MKMMRTKQQSEPLFFVEKFRNIFIMVCLLCLLSGCASNSSAADGGLTAPQQNLPTAEPAVNTKITLDPSQTEKQTNCPGLDSQLVQLIQADDPVALADQFGFKVHEDAIQVEILLSGEDNTFLADFDVQIGTVSGNKVQALVPFEQLCPLSNHENVLSIRLSAQVIR